jgi:hypothetical protein
MWVFDTNEISMPKNPYVLYAAYCSHFVSLIGWDQHASDEPPQSQLKERLERSAEPFRTYNLLAPFWGSDVTGTDDGVDCQLQLFEVHNRCILLL